MLRVGLTGGLGSGKSTVGAMLRALGAHVIEADAVGRAMMQPGQAVYQQIVEHFGSEVVGADGMLDRGALAQLAFEGGRLEELNSIVHPAVIAAQADWIRELARVEPHAVAVVESALIFETRHADATGWNKRFDRIILVTAPDELKISRFIDRAAHGRELTLAEHEALEADARRRLATQLPDEQKAALSHYIIHNAGPLQNTQAAVAHIYGELSALAAQ